MNDEAEIKRGPGRPRKMAVVERDARHEVIQHKMRAKPNWETMRPDEDETPDRLRISRDRIPEGMDAQWVTDSILGQPQPQRRALFERKGWTPVHQDDFDGRFDGEFMPTGAQGEIKVDGAVLMMRPLELSLRAKAADLRAAREQVSIKEQTLKGGDLGTSLDSQHHTALRSNKITKTIERIAIPEE